MAAVGAPTGPPGGENRDPNTSRIPPVPGPSRGGRGGGRGRGRTSGDGQESSRGRGGSSRGGGGSRRPFYPRFWASRRNDPPREKPVTIAIPSGVGGESPQIEAAPVNRRRTMANFAVTQSEKKYPDWKLYLPREAHMEGSPSAVKVAAFEDHIEKCSTHLYDLRQIHRKLHFDVSLDALKDDENFKKAWADFRNDLMNEPEQTLAYVGIAMHHRLLNFLRGQEIGCLQTISPRIVGFGPAMQLRSLKMTSCDKMICFIGTVARLGPSDIICTWMAFKCPECQTPQTVRQPDGVLTYPKSSSIQTILVEESIEDKNRDIFRKPRSIEVTLTNDLVNSVYPGGDVRVTGVLKLRTDDRKSDKPQNCTYYIHAVNVVSTSNPVVKKTTEFTEKSLRAIELIKTDTFPLRLLVHSLCPAVRGHEMIKFGFLLGLFSANMSTNRDHRQELHVLIVGDPGLGKSCLLKACCSVAPRAIFTSCSGSSVTGLTATVKAEKEDGSCSIEAGALVLADQGVCCIDEFDKMAVNHASMLEVMEQQSVSVAKAGAICTLPARTVILAAGNPANGHYDRSKTVCENIKLHPAILSRFDISFVILDEQRKDNWLRSQSNDSPTTPLYKRLELRPGEDLDALPHALFEKYIAYAQEKITVRLSKDAGELLQKFYLELRRIQDRSYHIPVTVRQLEGLTRMTLARARLDLCEVAEVHHAQDVIELMRYSMADVLSPDGGLTVDWQRGMHGSGMSKSVLVRKFFAECQDRAFQKGHPEFHMDEFTNIANKLGVKNVLQDILDSLNVQGYILNRGNGFYKVL